MEKLKAIAEWLQQRGITLYQVGGSVRDELMGLPVEDIDICVVGARSAEHMHSCLDELWVQKVLDFTSVHGDFPIWIVEIDGEKYEFAMARKERKNGQSHQDFLTEVNNVTIEQDLKRRDFTINAIAKHLLTGELVDPYKGKQHIEEKFLHITSPAFAEDPLRVLRAARFLARFEGFEPSLPLFFMCGEMGKRPEMKNGISNERVGKELMKMMQTATKPSVFFNFLKQVGWLKPWFEELWACIHVPQSPKNHPEGDVWKHTMHCIDAVANKDWFMRTVMLCHDLGKVSHTTVDAGVDGRINFQDLKEGQQYSQEGIKSAGHEAAGVELTRNMLQRIHFCDHATIRQIGCLVELHMIRAQINEKNYDKVVRKHLRRLMHYGLDYSDLCCVVYYDLSGRPPKPKPDLKVLYQELYYRYTLELIVKKEMEPIVTGKLLLSKGCEANQMMGNVIKHALELQDRGTLKKDNWLKVLYGAHPHYFRHLKEQIVNPAP